MVIMVIIVTGEDGIGIFVQRFCRPVSMSPLQAAPLGLSQRQTMVTRSMENSPLRYLPFRRGAAVDSAAVARNGL